MARRRSLRERFEVKFDRKDGDECWPWRAGTNAGGYGTINEGGNGRPLLAHRVAYTLYVGPIPDGAQLDHICRNHGCVNPAHLEPVTNLENQRRGIRAGQTHCRRGHAFDGNNLRIRKDGSRECIACLSLRNRWKNHPEEKDASDRRRSAFIHA